MYFPERFPIDELLTRHSNGSLGSTDKRAPQGVAPFAIVGLGLILIHFIGIPITNVSAILTSAGHDASVTDDPHKALELVSKEDFDVVITDLGMPRLNGWAVARQVKAKNAMTPVIVVTGWGAQYDKSDLLKHGVDMLFSKPLDRQSLIGAVEELADHSIRRLGRRRKHKRFPGKDGESVWVTPLSLGSETYVGKLLDISMSGLSFRQSESESLTGASLRIEIRAEEGFELDLSPSKVVYDMMSEQEPTLSEVKPTRRCGIQFEDLSRERLYQLESFVRSHASALI